MDILIISIIFYGISKLIEKNKDKKFDFNDLKKDIADIKSEFSTTKTKLNPKLNPKLKSTVNAEFFEIKTEETKQNRDENYGDYEVKKEIEKTINSENKKRVNLDFSKKDELKRAIIFSEVLGKPKALRKF